MKNFVVISTLCAVLLVVTQYIFDNILISFFIFIIWLSIINIGVFCFRSGIFCQGIPKKRIPGKLVLTIDDGPDPYLTEDLLDLLNKYHFSATFFLIGKDARLNKSLVNRIVDSGHTVGSHSYSHSPWLNFLLTAGWQKELSLTEEVLGKNLSFRWFRPPYALMSPHLANALDKENYQLVLFHIRPLDFGNRRIEKLAHNLLKNIEKGGVVLLHGKIFQRNIKLKIKLLEQLDIFFAGIQNRGLEVVSLEEYLLI